MAQQTAIKWLEKKIEEKGFQCQTEWQSGYQSALSEVIFFLEQAKAMEKHQIMSAYDLGNQNQYDKICISNYVNIDEEQYYNETYNK